MKKGVIIEQGALMCAVGSLHETTQSLINDISAIRPAPCFDIPVASAPFADCRLRELENAFSLLVDCVDLTGPRNERPLFIFAAAKGDIRSLEPHETNPALPSPLLSDQAKRVSRIAGITPASTMVISNACASGIVAVAVARFFLEREVYSSAVIAGFDVISRFVTSGFHSLGALSPAGARPFDATRDGLTLGDGAALAVLRFRELAGGDIVVAGADQSNDANHRTGPSRTGEGLHRAAVGALKNAGVAPEHVGAVKCHGTATAYNDAMEAKAINLCFADQPPPCFAIKGAIGHTSGAGSLIELLLAGEFLRRKTIPPTINFTVPDPEASIPVSKEAASFTNPSILCLSAGFGGLNAALLLEERRS
ncbi:MAG: hypothetical protein JW913_05235 [Chitinispirillaceae bacterium]|nr:hypothetical protein [Chitinispirillaceae bacterium]